MNFVWPTLDRLTVKERNELDRINKEDEVAINSAILLRDNGVLLEEARRLGQEEEERRRGTETKAINYLLAATALLPLVGALLGSVFEHKAGPAPSLIILPIIIVGVVYILGFAYWTFKTISVSQYHRIDARELIDTWKNLTDPVQVLIRKILVATRRNRDTINAKVSAIKMAHLFLLRVLFAFGLLIICEAAWGLFQKPSQKNNEKEQGCECNLLLSPSPQALDFSLLPRIDTCPKEATPPWRPTIHPTSNQPKCKAARPPH